MTLPGTPLLEDTTVTILAPLPDPPWLQMPEELSMWYLRFAKYFLPLGPSRTITRAYMLCLNAEKPDSPALKSGSLSAKGLPHWQRQHKKFRWHDRAEAFDRNNILEYSTLIDTARDKLMRNLDTAVTALVGALDNPRQAVAAAKEILDRGGLPGTTNIGIGPAKFTADELGKATTELDDWEHDHN